MKKRITIVSKGNKKALCYTALIVLTDSQAQKLASESLLKQIDNVAIDLAVEWAVEVSGNYEILAISRTTFSPIEEEMLKDIEKTAHEFLANVDKMELPKPEPECPSHESDNEEEKAQDAETLEFVKKLLNDINLPHEDDRHVCGALIIDTTTHSVFVEPTCWGKMNHDLLKEMCELYIKAHENDQ
jgi:hypothetical protein